MGGQPVAEGEEGAPVAACVGILEARDLVRADRATRCLDQPLVERALAGSGLGRRDELLALEQVGEPRIGGDEARRCALEEPEAARGPEILRHQGFPGSTASVSTAALSRPVLRPRAAESR